MGLPLSNAYVKPHVMRCRETIPEHFAEVVPTAFWACATAVRNPYYGKPNEPRFLLVNPPLGIGPDAPSAYADWVRKQPGV